MGNLPLVLNMRNITLTNVFNLCRFDPSIVVRIEKAILSGRPLLLMNCEDDSFDNMVSPLIHHANHGSEIQGPEGNW